MLTCWRSRIWRRRRPSGLEEGGSAGVLEVGVPGVYPWWRLSGVTGEGMLLLVMSPMSPLWASAKTLPWIRALPRGVMVAESVCCRSSWFSVSRLRTCSSSLHTKGQDLGFGVTLRQRPTHQARHTMPPALKGPMAWCKDFTMWRQPSAQNSLSSCGLWKAATGGDNHVLFSTDNVPSVCQGHTCGTAPLQQRRRPAPAATPSP